LSVFFKGLDFFGEKLIGLGKLSFLGSVFCFFCFLLFFFFFFFFLPLINNTRKKKKIKEKVEICFLCCSPFFVFFEN
jgi:4-amino-4-deoxy-L-arabinose transferase-like glycosyltransferase